MLLNEFKYPSVPELFSSRFQLTRHRRLGRAHPGRGSGLGAALREKNYKRLGVKIYHA